MLHYVTIQCRMLYEIVVYCANSLKKMHKNKKRNVLLSIHNYLQNQTQCPCGIILVFSIFASLMLISHSNWGHIFLWFPVKQNSPLTQRRKFHLRSVKESADMKSALRCPRG